MENDNNFNSVGKLYLTEVRGIKQEVLISLEQKDSIFYEENKICFKMKDLDGNVVGIQERLVEPIILNGKPIKSKTRLGTKVGYFYDKLDINKPVIISEGEIDTLSILDIPNVIGLQGISSLKKLIEQLKEKGVSTIYLLVDKDHPSDLAIGKLLDMDNTFLSNIFDSRKILGDYKDINDYLSSGATITMENIDLYGKSLGEFKKLTESFIIGDNTPRINHNEFAKYMIKKFTIASSNENLFIYDYKFNKGIWQPIDKQQMKKIIITELEFMLSYIISNFKNTDINNVLDFIIAHSKNEDLENALSYTNNVEICLLDGILDIKSMKTRDYMHTDYKFQKLIYGSNIFQNYTVPIKFLNFLNDILEGHENINGIIDFLQEFIGWLFIANTKFEKSLLLYGSGANGKGVLLSIIKELLGKLSCSSIGLHEINKDQYLYNLIGKLVNIDSDMQQNVQLDSGIIKKLVSGESISAKTVYKQPIEFVPYVRLLIATNELPYLKTIDNSIRRRFIFLHLKKSFYGKENPNLINEILQEKENIFVWAIDGLKRLIERDRFEIPQELEDEIDNFIKENDTVELFFDEGNVIIDDKEKIYNKDIYLLYKIFCSDSGYKALGQKNFNKRIKDKGFEIFRDSRGRGFLGLKENKPF